MLTKGPVAMLVFALCVMVYWAITGLKSIASFKQLFVFSVALLSIGGIWFLLLVATGNSHIIKEFFLYQIRLFNTQDSGHGGSFFYHWIVLLIGCFPASVFALRAFQKNNSDLPSQKSFKRWMLILFWVVLILFSIVETKIVHYSSLCYFPLTFLSAYTLYKLISGELEWKKSTSYLLCFIASLIGIAIMALPFIDKYKIQIINSGLIHDQFATENLKAQVYWSGYEWLIGAFLVASVFFILYSYRKTNSTKSLISILIVSMITINLDLIVIVPRVEKYSQGAAIEFYEQSQNKECYVETIGFFRYAHYFYTKKNVPSNKNSYDINWLLTGNIDKPAYFVCRVNSFEDIVKSYPELKEIYRKNGFVFLVRNVDTATTKN